MAFEYLQGQKLHSIFGQSMPVYGHPLSENVFPDVQSFLCFSMCPLPLVLSLCSTEKSPALSSLRSTGKSPAPSSLHPPFRYSYTLIRHPSTPSLCFSRLNSPSSHSFSSVMLQLLNQLCLPMPGFPVLTYTVEHRTEQSTPDMASALLNKARGFLTTSLDLLATFLLMQHKLQLAYSATRTYC